MSEVDTVGFPTQGDVIRFLYDATGVLPQKRDQLQCFDQQHRKTLQKALQRLAAEEGDLEERFDEMIRELSFLVSGHIEHIRCCLAVGHVLLDVLSAYRKVVKEEGTYLGKRETLRWMLDERLVPVAAASVAVHLTRYDLRGLAATMPDTPCWYLPDINGAETVWPLEKVMHWIYGCAGTDITEFHYPERKTGKHDPGRHNDRENVDNWLNGRAIPSAAALRWTFDRGFEARAAPTSDASRPVGVFTTEQLEGAHTALFLARFLTFIARKVEADFGVEFLGHLCQLFQRRLSLALRAMKPQGIA